MYVRALLANRQLRYMTVSFQFAFEREIYKLILALSGIVADNYNALVFVIDMVNQNMARPNYIISEPGKFTSAHYRSLIFNIPRQAKTYD